MDKPRKIPKRKVTLVPLWIVGGVLVLSALFFFTIPLPMQNLDYLQGKLVHYSGTSTITPDQFADSETKQGVMFESLDRLDSGLVQVKYDTYKPAVIDYLTKTGFNVWDMPAIHIVNWLGLLMELPVFGVLFLFVLLFSRFVGGSLAKNPDKFADGILYRMSRVWDSWGKNELNIGKAMVADKVEIDTRNLNGIMAVRTWNPFWGSSLRSSVQQTTWRDKVMVADKLPERDNTSGIYAYRLGSSQVNRVQFRRIFGIVEMTGHYEYHADGTIRAERCEIKLIVCYDGFYNRGRQISGRYGVPVYFTQDPFAVYHTWLFGENGMKCLVHNYRILNQPGIFDEIQKILKEATE